MSPIQVIKDKEAPALALLVLFIKKYGIDALYWEPEIIDSELTKDFDTKISPLQFEKLHAAINVLINNTYEVYWETFETTNHIFSNTPHIPGDHSPLQPEEIVVGYAQAMLIRNEAIILDDEICRYMGQVFYDAGLSKPPAIVPFTLMPEETLPSDDSDYREGLQELWEVAVNRTVDYMSHLKF